MKHRYYFLDMLRGLAVVTIVMHHVTSEAIRRHGYVYLSGLFRNEIGAVDFFFLLSGFVLTLAHYRNRGNHRLFLPFMKKRLLRIMPVYWLVCTFVIALYLVWRPPLAGLYKYDLNFFLGNYLLLPQSPLVITPAWFLQYEILYYFLFATVLFLIRKRHTIYILGVFSAVLVFMFSVQANILGTHALAGMFFSVYTLEFISGIIAGLVFFRYRDRISGIWLTGLGASLFFIVNFIVASVTNHREVYETSLQNYRFLFFGIPLVCIILGVMKLERDGRWKAPPLLVLLGKSAYVMYLGHMVILQSLFIKTERVMRLTGPHGGFAAGITLIVLLTVVASVALHLFIEKTALIRIRRSHEKRP